MSSLENTHIHHHMVSIIVEKENDRLGPPGPFFVLPSESPAFSCFHDKKKKNHNINSISGFNDAAQKV